MMENEIYRKIRNGVCAIGFLTKTLEIYQQDIEGEIFRVIGTGFLVDKTTVITNRHVITGLLEEKVKRNIPNNQLFIQFVVPGKEGLLRIVPRLIRQISYIDDYSLDIGLIKYRIVYEDHFESISPLTMINDWNLNVSEEVGICGYPYGTSILAEGEIFRWGPVLQQGHVSAISPFDTTELPDKILLDVRTAGGMSGAPIFRPESGEVIGINFAKIESVIAFGIPLTTNTIKRVFQDLNNKYIDLNEP